MTAQRNSPFYMIYLGRTSYPHKFYRDYTRLVKVCKLVSFIIYSYIAIAILCSCSPHSYLSLKASIPYYEEIYISVKAFKCIQMSIKRSALIGASAKEIWELPNENVISCPLSLSTHTDL